MDQFRKLITALSLKQRIGIVAAAILTIAGVVSFVHWRHEQSFRPLFTGMGPEDAAAIVQKLKEGGVEHRLTDNGTAVLVSEDKVDELRLEMAGAGLPRTGRIGFELFDKTNIGVTDFAEHVNYRRALEGELERSVRALSEVEQARIHISFPKDSVFLDAREPAKASVLVTLKPGRQLNQQNVLAITNLVASAVEGLTPDFVSVVDMQGNLLSRPKRSTLDGSDNSDATLDYKRQVEKDLMAKVESTLGPLLGDGKFRVGMSVDCDLTTTEQTDEVYDPTKSVMVTSQKSEDLAGGAQALAGVPGTASNLPRPPVQTVTGPGSGMSRRTENAAYESSRTVREVKTPRGTIKRISASVLLDEPTEWQGTGKRRKRIPAPLSADKLKAIHDIVAGVIGLDATRGDQLVLESLPFERDAELDNAPVEAEPGAQHVNTFNNLIKDWRVLVGIGAVVLLLIGAGVFVLRQRAKAKALAEANAVEMPEQAALGNAEQTPALPPAESSDEVHPRLFQLAAGDRTLDRYKRDLVEVVTKDPELAAGVLRGWLDDDGL